jgi:hypothetical protein
MTRPAWPLAVLYLAPDLIRRVMPPPLMVIIAPLVAKQDQRHGVTVLHGHGDFIIEGITRIGLTAIGIGRVAVFRIGRRRILGCGRIHIT